jgi:hypothetical protein
LRPQTHSARYPRHPTGRARRGGALHSRLAPIGLFAVLIAFLVPAAALGNNGQIKLALLPVGQPGSFFDLSMLPGETRSLAVDIANDGEAALVARTYVADVYTIINGGFGARLRDERRSGTTEWLDYQTDLLPLAVGAAIRRTFAVTVPADTGPGEYITSIILENDLPLHSSGAVGLNQVIRQAVAVVVTVPGQHSPRLAVGAASHKFVAGRSVVSVAVDNSGNVRLKPLVGFELVDASGTQVSQASVQMDTFYAETSTFVEVQLASLLVPGAYTVRLTIEDSAHGMQALAAVIPLIVEPAAPVASAAGGLVPGLTHVTQVDRHGPLPSLAFIGLLLLAGVVLGFGWRALVRRDRKGHRPVRASSP